MTKNWNLALPAKTARHVGNHHYALKLGPLLFTHHSPKLGQGATRPQVIIAPTDRTQTPTIGKEIENEFSSAQNL